ncbi:MAG TPA: LytTR family DNA-binding domain-containing protein [Chitinophagaceae bacterium]|nr:LytTR family DNA-binding domain-containing protein [Chitinophagaceae bacterium]
MIRAIIVDDEPKNRKVLRSLLTDFCPEVSIAGEAGSAEEASKVVSNENPDLLFLDIEMPYGNAFDLLDKLMPVNFEIIFITAFDEYTLKAFRYSALDYLLKPVDIEELKTAVKKASEKIHLKNLNRQLANLLQNIHPSRTATPKIALPTQDGFVFQSTKDIIRFEAKGNYTYIFTNDGQKHISSRTIRQYEEMLPDKLFFRIHNSHIINLNYIKKYNKGRGGQVIMTDGSILEVATRRKDDFLALFEGR